MAPKESTFNFAMEAFRKYFKYKTKVDWTQGDIPIAGLYDGTNDRFTYVKSVPAASETPHDSTSSSNEHGMPTQSTKRTEQDLETRAPTPESR